jgi:hypothetical protein
MNIAALISTAFKRLKTIQSADPELTPENWCELQPCLTFKLGPHEIVLSQPFSSVLVYSLGLLGTGIGMRFLWIRGDELSRLWWGVSLLLWGFGALLAGTSYQAFGYHIKCAGQEICAWTSWWEVVYLIIQGLSLNTLLVAVAYSSTEGNLQIILQGYALAVGVIYTILTFLGGIIPIKQLITFELMVWVSSPALLMMGILNGWRYYHFRTPLDLVLLGAWGLLLLILTAYWLYQKFNITAKLWTKGEGIWFSQNDLLHLGLILWMIYIGTVAVQWVKDYDGLMQ